jgi:hypothetical protein
MVARALSVAERGRAAAEGLVVGAVTGELGRRWRPSDVPEPRPLAADVGLLALERLGASQPDLQALAQAWAGTAATATSGSSAVLTALDALRVHGAPIAEPVGPAPEAVLVGVAVGIRASASPRHLLSAPLHLAALLGPGARTVWSAVALAVGCGSLIAGASEAVVDVIDALRAAQGAPDVLALVREVPRWREADLPAALAAQPDELAVLGAALWFGERAGAAPRLLESLLLPDEPAARRAAITAGALATAAARRGPTAIPDGWRAPDSWRARIDAIG